MSALFIAAGVCVLAGPAWATGGYTITSIGLNAVAINDNAQVVGQAGPGGDNAYLYSNGTLTALGNLPGGSQGNPTGINIGGQVVGSDVVSLGVSRAFLYSDGTMVNLGTFLGGGSSFATGINDSGQVQGLPTPRPMRKMRLSIATEQ